MNENIYSTDNFTTYPQQVQMKQNVAENQPYFPSYSPAIFNNYSQNSNYVDVCSSSSTSNQSTNRNQVCVGYQDPSDVLNWDNRGIPEIEKGMKFPDKMEMIEITSKDLSPASYCSNIDLLVPDLYKTTQGREANTFNQCCFSQNSCNQRNYEYPLPAQYSSQKNYETDSSLKSCSFTADIFIDNNELTSKVSNYNKSYCDYTDYNMYNYYDKSHDPQITPDFLNNSLNLQFDPIINQQTEDSNDDSDIIVEDSDDEMNSYDIQEKNHQFSKFDKCLICNLVYTPCGIQFYFLTSKSPLTMSTQKPILSKITELIGKVLATKTYLCCECLGLINTIDHLQLKLKTFNTEFLAKYKKTCEENNTQYTVVENTKKNINKRKLRYKCKICKKVLCLQKYFFYHKKKHKRASLLCELCGKICASRKKFIIHKQNHTKQNMVKKFDPFKCSNCLKCFRTNSQLKLHQNVCLGTLPYECKQKDCDKKFASSTQLKYHTKLKHDKKFVAICSICNIGFVKLAAYKNHKVTHSTEKKYSCNQCDKSYKTISNLRFHMKVHNTVLPYKCHICKKGFLRKDYLETHINKHNGVRNFECPVCKKNFLSQKNLDSHSKYHEDSKKITCNICGKSMINGFKDHLRVHNNLKEFECNQCDMKFNTKGALNKHLKNKHSD